MGNLQGAQRATVMAVGGFLSLILAIIVLCFSLFVVYNCFYHRAILRHLKMRDSAAKSETQSTNIDISLAECQDLLRCRIESEGTRQWQALSNVQDTLCFSTFFFSEGNLLNSSNNFWLLVYLLTVYNLKMTTSHWGSILKRYSILIHLYFNANCSHVMFRARFSKRRCNQLRKVYNFKRLTVNCVQLVNKKVVWKFFFVFHRN